MRQEYVQLVSNMDSEAYKIVKQKAIRQRQFFRELCIGEVVCPISESVIDAEETCANCTVKASCPARS